MKYLNYTLTGAYFAKLLGTYELELAGIFENLRLFDFKQVVVVGSGEGYYPVGLMSHLNTPVIAYERNGEAETAIGELASLNEVKRPEFGGTCSPQSLNGISKSLIFMDIEGEELEFLNSGVIHKLTDSFWIIEIHGERIKNLFIQQLEPHYQIEFIPTRSRTMQDFPVELNRFLRWILSRYWLCLMQEWRGKDEGSSIGWLILKPLNIGQ